VKALCAADMKNLNRKMIFDIVRSEREITRVGLSRLTGMSSPSIVTIVDEFVESGILVPAGMAESTAIGRKSLRLRFNPDVMLSIGIEFEGDCLSVGVVNLDGDISFQILSRIPSRFGPAFFDVLAGSIQRIQTQLEKIKKNYYGIGLGIPGAMNVNTRVIYLAPYIGVMQPTDISEMIAGIEKRFGKPVFLENDVNASAIGEYYVGRYDRKDDLLYVSIGAGLGAGVILGGKLRHGPNYMCGEIGYSVMEHTQPVTSKEVGWLERQISSEGPDPQFGLRINSGGATEADMRHVVEQTVPFVANIVNTLDLPQVVLGGTATRQLGEPFIELYREMLSRLTLFPARVEKCRSEFAGIVGTAMIASNQQLKNIL